MDRLIRVGRIFITLFIVLFSLTMIAVCATKVGETEEDFIDEDLHKFEVMAYVIYSFLFIGLFISVIILARYMRAKKQMIENLDTMSERTIKDDESCAIISILMIFDLSFALKIVYDTNLFIDNIQMSQFSIYLVSLLSCIPFDILPITLILILHRKNFQKASNYETITEVRTTYNSTFTGTRSNVRQSTVTNPDNNRNLSLS